MNHEERIEHLLQQWKERRAAHKFPVLIIQGDRAPIFPVAFAQENRDKYRREGHEVKYVELAGHGHTWATKADVNETIWEFFADHPLAKK
jgi:pimeloyl-ACP methyl ester carboxylesterase